MGDEPTGNLDSKTSREVITMFRKLNEERNITIILVTHDQAIAKNADRIIVLRDGLIVKDTANSQEAFEALNSFELSEEAEEEADLAKESDQSSQSENSEVAEA
jgi:ABC-type multidrug transport system ATPase subunit